MSLFHYSITATSLIFLFQLKWTTSYLSNPSLLGRKSSNTLIRPKRRITGIRPLLLVNKQTEQQPRSGRFVLNSSNSENDESKEPSFHHKISLPDSFYTQVLSTNSISSVATKLRQSYNDRFKDPREPNSNRFIWDPWYVTVGDGLMTKKLNEEGNDEKAQEDPESESSITIDGEEEATSKQVQYSLKRVQSSTFFTDDEFGDLVDELTVLGRSIGLTAITPPWMSLYTNGDQQNSHTDAPQGQIAFVLSLCQEGDFDGGETIMLKDDILDYWKGFDGSRGLESGGILRYIPPTPLGRCIVFDPRVPHGVNLVQGQQDPRKGRVVIHGWFNEPEVCWFGPWGDEDANTIDDNPSIQQANQILDDAFQPLLKTLGGGEIGRVMGYLAIQLEINEYGEVVDVSAVCDTLKADWEDYRGIIGYDEADRPVMEDAVSDVKLTIYETMKNLNFEDGKTGRSVVVPFAFE